MLIGYSSLKKKGYDAQELINVIGGLIDHEESLSVAVVGMGNLGRAITAYFNGKRPKLNIVAAFDVDPNKVNRVVAGVNCFHMKDLNDVVKRSNISIAIIAAPPDSATTVAELLVNAGIKGILNFTTVPVNVPESIYLEEYDMITSLEKVAYFVKQS
jgi:redox-sensing transcriptional repressor